MRAAEPISPASPLAVPAWACFLACSWTWCIGMFLPILLVRDLGLGAFAVFAVPNIVGAAAMGWVLARPGASEGLVGAHADACMAFSRITISFHLFFVFWLIVRIGAGPWLWLAALLAVGANAAGILTRRPLLTPALVLGISIGAAAIMATTAGFGIRGQGEGLGALPPADLLWIAPVMALGFILCPYLDLTFHNARQALPPGRAGAAFSLGFGVPFLAMLLFTLGYSAWLTLDVPGPALHGGIPASAATAILVHIFVQSFFTTTLHLGAVSAARRARRRAGPDVAGVAAVFIPLVLVLLLPVVPERAGLSAGEVVYRAFMAFYGLVFPAYVWLCMIPTRDGHSGLSRRKVRVLAFTIGLAAPMFYMGFIEQQTWWLAPGVGVVLAARLFSRRGASG